MTASEALTGIAAFAAQTVVDALDAFDPGSPNDTDETPGGSIEVTDRPPGLADVELTLITSLEDVGDYLRWLGNRRPYHAIALDTETTGLDPFSDRVRLIQVGDHAHGWAMDRDMWLGVLRDTIDRWDGDWLLHNAPFDTLSLGESCGVEVPRHRIQDTMVEARINESHMSMALKSQSARHVAPEAAGLQMALEGTGYDWKTVPIEFERYWEYGALDPVLTYQLHMHHYPIVQREAPAAFDLEMAVLWVVERMRRYGTRIDREFVREHYDKFTDYCDQVERWCQSEYGVRPGSNAAVIGVLERDGFSFSKATQAGAKSLDAEVLEGIDHPLARSVLGRRQAQKMASTYLRFYLNRADSQDLIHPSFNTLGARTSRMSCSDPNLQNLPRLGSTPFADVVRNAIRTRWGTWADDESPLDNAHRRGSLVMCDFDQIEMRMMAHFAQEPAMIAAFRGDDDFFVTLARQIFHDNEIDKKDRRRQITKNAGYATIYAAGIRKFSLTAGIPESEGREFMRRWNEMYPHVRRFQDLVLNTALDRQSREGVAYVRSPFTNRRYVGDRRKEYALVNYLIQGGAAEVNKMKLIELDAAGLGEWMFASVHDEVLLDTPGEHFPDVVRTVGKIMSDADMLSVPITASVSFGERWGRKHSLPDGWEEPTRVSAS